MLISPVGGYPARDISHVAGGGWGALVIRDFTSTGKTLPPIRAKDAKAKLLQQVAASD